MGKKRKSSAGRSFLKAACIFCGILLALAIGATAFVHHWLDKINYVEPEQQVTLSAEEVEEYLATEETEETDPTAVVLEDEELDWGENTMPIDQKEEIVNILLIGQDARPGETRARSDVMILVTINKTDKTLTMTSFLRDLYVQIPGYKNNRLNAAYAWGGMELLDNTLEYNFGIRVDGNLEVNFDRFADLIELLGGVDIEITANEAAQINQSLGYEALGSGTQHLNGDQALAYARIRKIDSDFNRTNRQRKLLTALIEKFRSSDLNTLMALLNEALPMLTTDMSKSQILGYAMELLPLLPELTVVSQRIPADGAYVDATISGMAVLKADMDAARELLEDTLGAD